jgi:hypothetical protein
MNNRKLLVLSIIAAASVLWAVIQAQISKPQAAVSSAGSPLIQGLEPGRIGSIVIDSAGGTVTLEREGKGFVVADREGYPAETSKINNLIMSCFDVRTIELITDDTRNHSDLEVAKANANNIVKFLDSNDKIITGLVTGKSDPQTKVTYARQVSSDEVFSVAKAPTVRTSATDYMDTQITDVDSEDVVRVTLNGPEGSFTVRTDANDTVIVKEMPAEKKLKESDAKNVMSALSGLSFADVKKESSFGQDTLKFDGMFICEMGDSTIYTFNITSVLNKTYVKCSAEYTADLTNIVQSTDNLEGKEAKLLARDAAVSFTNRHQGWVYEIPQYKVENLTKKLTELIEEPEAEEEPVKALKSTMPDLPGTSELPRIQ